MRFGHQTVVLVGNATLLLSLAKENAPTFVKASGRGNTIRTSNGGFGGKRDSAAELSKRKTPRLLSRRLAGETRFGHQTVVLVGNAILPLSWAKRKRPDFYRGVWQGKHDSNMQPTVLETATLPLSYSPKTFSLVIIYYQNSLVN